MSSLFADTTSARLGLGHDKDWVPLETETFPFRNPAQNLAMLPTMIVSASLLGILV